jgi:carbonic anhydrase/acetyltransferase-like protein (isoleucine patch superfamily)
MIKSFKGTTPIIDRSAFVAENTAVIGDVQIAANVSVWYGVTIRGDINSVSIGRDSNIQENTVIHVDLNDRGLGDCSTVIGERVTVGHGVILHGCKIGDDCLIGMGAIVLSGARIGAGSVIGAGALVRERQEIPPRSMVLGIPAEVKRSIKDEEIELIKSSAQHYVDLAGEYKE